jgi:hypothetical protein
MNTTPDTETNEAVGQLCDAALMWEGSLEAPADFPGTLTEAFAPIVAEIRRHAAADALKQQAQALRQVNRNYLKQLQGYEHGSDAYKLTFARGQQVSADARRLENAAHDVIAEGWEHTCYATWAATRDDPGYGCDNPVEQEGDYCSKHEPEDDEDRWAE